MKYMTSVIIYQVFLYVDKSVFMPTISNAMLGISMTSRERALELIRTRGIARARDFKAAGVP
ncbi:MAG: hypothetical protein ABR550_10375, partial [Wenzhouxiangellaceae bacterium]